MVGSGFGCLEVLVYVVFIGVFFIIIRGFVGEVIVVLVMLMMVWSLLVLLMWRKLVGIIGYVIGWYVV